MPSTIRDLTELTAVAVDDYLLISDTSDVTNRDKRISTTNLLLNMARKAGTPVAGRVAGWADANTVNDGGFAISDIARLSLNNVFGGTQFMNGGIRSYSVSLNDASFAQTTPPGVGGMVLVQCSNSNLVCGIANYRTNTYMTSLIALANLVFTTGVLTGTTGTAGKVTVSTAGTDIYIENRLGATRTITMLFII
jgi:hypothetical protein